MQTLNVKIPSINQSYYDSVAAKANEAKVINVIRPKFGKYINNIANIVRLPAELLESFIFIESGGNDKSQSPYAIGLMQLNGATASDALVFEKGKNRLEKSESDLLKKYLGSRYSTLDKVKPNQKSLGVSFITKDDLLKPELNILIGAILLKQLVDEFTEKNGVVRLDKVISVYNGGRYSKSNKKVIPFTGNIEELITIVPKETSAYIKKLVGVKGMLDTLI